jgi:hypothetical protein
MGANEQQIPEDILASSERSVNAQRYGACERPRKSPRIQGMIPMVPLLPWVG